MTLVPLPPGCSELKRSKTSGQFMQHNWLSNRVFTSCANIQPLLRGLEQGHWEAVSVGLRDWANGF